MSVHKRLRKGASLRTQAEGPTTPTFKEQRRPKFVIPKPRVSSPGQDESRHSPLAQQRQVPQFDIHGPTAGRRGTETTGTVRRTPVFRFQPTAEREEVATHQDSDDECRHNPFDVSEDLDEPRTQSATPRRTGPSRFLTSATSTARQRPTSTGAVRSTTEVLSSLRFDTQSPGSRNGHGVTVSADWSPHKRRSSKLVENNKFLPGGLAETVALWIYEEQCKSDNG